MNGQIECTIDKILRYLIIEKMDIFLSIKFEL